MLTLLAKILKALNSEQSPSQLAIAVSLAAILGLTPLLSFHNILVILIALWFRVNLGILLVSYPLFMLLGWMLAPGFDSVGYWLLEMPSLQTFWEVLYNQLGGRWSGFYYTGRLGSFVVSIIVAIVLFPIMRFAVVKYREVVLAKMQKSRLMVWLRASKLWQLYSGFSE